MTDLVYYNINEEGTVYNRSTDLAEASKLLEEFPNDTLVTCTAGSPTDRAHQRQADTDYKSFSVEVQPALIYNVEVLAKGPAHAAWLADKEPMPSPSEMQVIDGWVYIVEDAESGERTFDSEDSGMPDSEEEALIWDEGGD